MPKINAIYVLCILLLFIACDKTRVYEDYVETGGVWHKDSLATFNFEITDTTIKYNFNINVRNMGTYPYSNLWLFVDLINPDNTFSRDTIEYELARADGKWLGTGIGDLYDCKWQFKVNHLFSEPGSYTIKIQQAMRTDKLPGIHDVGFRVEIAQP